MLRCNSYKFQLPFLLLCLWSISAISQPKQSLKFITYTKEDGLADDVMEFLVQDSIGYLWMASQAGISRFNGYTFENFYHDAKDSTTISYGEISSLHIDGLGRIWAGTSEGGLNLFDRFQQKFIHYESALRESGWQQSEITDIVSDSKQQLWLATEKGLIYYEPHSGQATLFSSDSVTDSIPSNQIEDLQWDFQGNLWVATKDAGVFVLNPNTGAYEHFQHDPNNINSPSSNQINCLFESEDSLMWIGSANAGFTTYDFRNQVFSRSNELEKYSSFNRSVKDFAEDNQGQIWVASWSGGLHIIDAARKQMTPHPVDPDSPFPLGDSRLLGVHKDREGLMWVTTQSGLSKHDPSTEIFTHYYSQRDKPHSLPDNHLYGVLYDSQGGLWVSTLSKGLVQYKKGIEGYWQYQKGSGPSSMMGRVAFSMMEDSKGQVWIGVSGGIQRYNRQSNTFERFLDSPDRLQRQTVMCIYEDRKGVFWLGTWGGGLASFNPQTDEFRFYKHDEQDPESLSNNVVRVVSEDAQGRLWVGTYEGISILNRSTGKFENIPARPESEHGLPNRFVYTFHLDGQGRMWVGTEGGIARYRPKTQDFANYLTLGKERPFITAKIMEDSHQNLWLSTKSGLCRFSMVTEEAVWFDQYDGLQGLNFGMSHGVKDEFGKMYFPGKGGLTVFHPDSIVFNRYKPNVVITSFMLFNKEVEVGPSSPLKQSLNLVPRLELDYDQNIFSFDFAALNYRQPEKNNYKYKMDGVDQEWIEADHRFRRASYTKLAPGKYTFHVIASNDDDVWNEKGLSIQVNIAPPWWETWWAQTLWWMIPIVGTLLVFWWRVSSLNAQKEELERQVRERTIEITQQKEEIEVQAEKLRELGQFKENMTGMIVHDLKNPLNTIINAPENKGLEALKRAKEAGRYMLQIVLNILDVYKYQESQMEVQVEDIPLMSLIAEGVKEVEFLAKEKNIGIAVQVEEGVVVRADASVMLRVITNLLTNAIKYSELNASIQIRGLWEVSRGEAGSASLFRVMVIDQGIGIPSDKLEYVFNAFSQVSPQRSGSIRSTGLGLAFCKAAVEAHQGRIGVDSELGKGSEFWFALPAKQAHESEGEVVGLTEEQPRLSVEVRQELELYLVQLRKYELYELSKIEEILEAIERQHQQKEIQLWVESIRQAVYSSNLEYYRSLIA